MPTPIEDMENNAVLAERYAGILAEKIAKLVAHVEADTMPTDTTRAAVNNTAAIAGAVLARLTDACAKRRERNERRAA
jgi:hypothetical protein